MADLNGFNANDVPPSSPSRTYELLPDGRYEVIATASDLREARNGVGTYVQMEFEVVAGDHRGRRLWDRFIMEHPNPKAVDMGRLQLASLCRAVGKASPADSSDLHDVPVVAIVTQEARKDTGELVNRIKGYEAAGGPQVTRPSFGGNGHAGGTIRKPWERGIPI